jgi:N-acetyl-anhydromuramyl-L-alanine amidase AmpD
MNIRPLQTPLPSRERDTLPVLVVLHATAGSTARSSIDHLRSVGLSYHYIITRDARDSAKVENTDNSEPVVHQCVPNLRQAFHVGSTIPAPGGRSINRSSIGISLANIQRKKNPEQYPPKQIQALDELLAHLKQEVPSLRFLTTHAAVQPWNRADPLEIIGKDLAEKHGYEWWEPTKEQIKAHTPKK